VRLAAALLLVGCGTTGETGPIYETISFAAEVQPLLASCSGCHQGATPDGALDLSGDLYDKLVEQPSGQSELLLVEPGDSRYSYVWHKLNGSQSVAGGAGTRMPLGAPLSDDDIDLIALWIDTGAEP
jgi:cytochrome c553